MLVATPVLGLIDEPFLFQSSYGSDAIMMMMMMISKYLAGEVCLFWICL
jgi:hypothetical protein